MVQLGATAGHLVLGTTVGDDGVLGAQALGGTDGVHGHVAAAKDNDVLAVLGGGVVLGELVGLHQVHAGEVLVREEDVGQVLAGDVEELGQASAGRHVDSVEALLEQLLGRGHVAHDGVVLKLDAHVLQAINLALDDCLGQTELGDAVDQHAAAGEEASKTVTSKPLRASSPAQVMPDGPEPTTATFLPFLGAILGVEASSGRSPRKRSSWPMATGRTSCHGCTCPRTGSPAGRRGRRWREAWSPREWYRERRRSPSR